MEEKSYGILASNILLTRTNKDGKKEVLLQLRKNTGFMDNMYDVSCGGHVKKGESLLKTAVREAKEEIGIDIKEEDLELLAVNHDCKTNYVKLFFTTNIYDGEPKICEPDEIGELLWVDIDNLPENTIPYVIGFIDGLKYGIQCDDGEFTILKKRKASSNK